jgi:hypothetical protein
LKSKLINVERLIYGNYKSADYKKLLSEVDLCVFFSPSESQGIALAESWASDVPTWVYERGFWTAPNGDVYSSSSAPYLTDYTGNFFTSINEFNDLINFIAILNTCLRAGGKLCRLSGSDLPPICRLPLNTLLIQR